MCNQGLLYMLQHICTLQYQCDSARFSNKGSKNGNVWFRSLNFHTRRYQYGPNNSSRTDNLVSSKDTTPSTKWWVENMGKSLSSVWFLHEELFQQHSHFRAKGRKHNFLMEPPSIAMLPDSGVVTPRIFLHWLQHLQGNVRSCTKNPCLLILCNLQSIPVGNFLFSRCSSGSHRATPLARPSLASGSFLSFRAW
jgi:hypothetical protein